MSCLNGQLAGLPSCSWAEFCDIVGIEQPEWAQVFLRMVATHYGTSSTADLPEECTRLAQQESKDSFVVWVWMLTPEFRPELPGMDMDLDPLVPDNYYLLNVMRENCKQCPKNWSALADECMLDRERYAEVQRRLALRLNFAGVFEVGRRLQDP